MNVLVVERATPSLRGQITRWMLEVRAGVFVGSLSPRVRDELWKLVCARNAEGGSVLVSSAPGEQGFTVLSSGDGSRSIIDMEGLVLVRRPPASSAAAPREPRKGRGGRTRGARG